MLLTISIDGEWSARELAEVLDSLEALAGYFDSGKIVRMGLQPPKVESAVGGVTILPNDPLPSHLNLVRFLYASPGSFDLLGLAKIIEQIRLFLEFAINLWVTRNDRKLDREERYIQVAEKKIELIDKIRGIQPNVIQFIENEAADSILGAILEGKFTSVSSTTTDKGETK